MVEFKRQISFSKKDYNLSALRRMMLALILIVIHLSKTSSYGYDSGTDQGACGKPARTARLYLPPCDIRRESYCTSAGTTYPWHAVRRFVRENQGLMRRMYGDERHIAVLRAEMGTNDYEQFNEVHRFDSHENDFLFRNVDFKNRYTREQFVNDNELFKDESSPRLLQDDPKLGEVLNTKFVYSDHLDFKTKFMDLTNVPHFRQTSTEKSVEVEAAEDTRSAPVNSTYENSSEFLNDSTIADLTTTTENVTETATEELTTEYLSTTESVSEEVATEGIEKKETTGEVLFQDMENSKKNQNQINYKLKGVNACPVKEEVVAPFWANNTRGEVLALLNLYPFEQYVHWEKCTYEHRQMYCREGCRCEQQYRLHRLLAYDPNNECRGIFSDWFKFPSCCVCKCYNIPPDFRVTSRSPRTREKGSIENDLPEWFKKRNYGESNDN